MMTAFKAALGLGELGRDWFDGLTDSPQDDDRLRFKVNADRKTEAWRASRD